MANYLEENYDPSFAYKQNEEDEWEPSDVIDESFFDDLESFDLWDDLM